MGLRRGGWCQGNRALRAKLTHLDLHSAFGSERLQVGKAPVRQENHSHTAWSLVAGTPAGGHGKREGRAVCQDQGWRGGQRGRVEGLGTQRTLAGTQFLD